MQELANLVGIILLQDRFFICDPNLDVLFVYTVFDLITALCALIITNVVHMDSSHSQLHFLF